MTQQRAISTIFAALVVAATVVAAAAVAAVLTGVLDRRAPVTASEEPSCTAWDMSMDETITQMFALMGTDADRLARCWTSGEADLAVLTAYVAAGAPVSYVLDNEHSRGRDGVLYAAVRVRANWAASSPPGWDPSELQTIVMRQHRDWSWTIDTIQPRTREAMSDSHCGVCHR